MPKPDSIELPGCEPIPILYEDRSVIAVDKPRGWMLVPHTWQKTNRNLQAAITSSIAGRDFWVSSRNLKFLRHVHRLDADTTGILLFARSPGAVEAFSDLFEGRKIEKTYLAVVSNTQKGEPRAEWTCQVKLAPDPRQPGKMNADPHNGKESETHFKVLEMGGKFTLLEAKPVTGRTHQIRVHLLESGLPIIGDELYGKREGELPLGLRAIKLAYLDPFTRRRVEISAPADEFLNEFGF
ncbi:MAG TPA: RluA family pseudouridine synthase [Verrucomicrobiae bacterium]|nr:RluA family pseudouridine synthase [Verrucomicrobiae bacterium]